MNGLNNIYNPFERVLKARSIMARVKSRLSPSEAPAVNEPPVQPAVFIIAPDLCFSPEPDGALEVIWAAPEFVPCWAKPGAARFSDLDMDDFSAFQAADGRLMEAPEMKMEVAEDTSTEEEDTSTEETALFPLVVSPALPADASLPAQEAVAEEAPVMEAETPPPVIGKPQSVLELERAVTRAASVVKPPVRWSFGRKALLASLATAAAILLIVSVCLKDARETTTIVLNIDDDAPLVDLGGEEAEAPDPPVMELETPVAATEPKAEAEPTQFISSEELLAEQETVAASVETAKAPSAASVPFISMTTSAAAPEKPGPTFLTQVGGSVKRIIASPTLQTISYELGIAPSAGDGEDDEAEPVYTLSAFPDRLTAGRATDVVFVLKAFGRPLPGSEYKLRFENNPAFPNLRDTLRYPDEEGRITVKGLKPAQSGVASLRLLVNDDYVDAPLYVAAPGVEAPVPPALAPPSASAERPVAADLSRDEELLMTELLAPPIEEWTISPGLLRGQMEGWASRAGYQLVWEAKNDFEMSSQATFQGDYLASVKTLFTAMHDQGNPLRATVYQGNKVLKVTEE